MNFELNHAVIPHPVLELGHTCSVVRRTKPLIRQYLLPLETDHPGVVLVIGDLGSPLNQYSSQVNRGKCLYLTR